ncbi:MAG: ATP-binding protein [Chthoniobacterales bacterium]
MSTLAKTSAKASDRHGHFPIRLSDLAQALDHSQEGFALTDPEGNYVYINEAHVRMYGYDEPQELLGRSWRLLYTPEWVRHFEEAVIPLIPRDKVWRGQVLGRRRDGSSFLAGVTLTLLPDGKITCNCRDESDRRETTEAPSGHSALRDLGERIIASLPSRMRRPLDLLNGYASFLLGEVEAGRHPDAEALRAGLGEIGATGRRLAEQMRRLDLVAELAARDEFGSDGPGSPGEDWPRGLDRACRQRAALAGRAPDLQIMLGQGIPALDYRPLETVVLELLANAIQSSRSGDALRIDGRIEANRYVLRICDEGVGLPPENLEDETGRPFGQTAPSGFGLSVVRFIVQRAGGSLESDESSPCSTCLRLTLPLRS